MTLSEFRSIIRSDISMNDTSFLPNTLLDDFINRGISKAERIIHTLYEDYFKTFIDLKLVSGRAAYSLPVDIYAEKIKNFIYASGTDVYEITAIDDEYKTLKTTTPYQYDLLNVGNVVVNSYTVGTKTVVFKTDHYLSVGDSVTFYQSDLSTIRGSADVVASVVDAYTITITTGIAALTGNDVLRKVGTTIMIYPTPSETVDHTCKLYYLRDARKLVNTGDICDIPEFESFVIVYAKMRCLFRDVKNPLLQDVKEEYAFEKQELIETLSKRQPNKDNVLRQDLSFYNDFDTIY